MVRVPTGGWRGGGGLSTSLEKVTMVEENLGQILRAKNPGANLSFNYFCSCGIG